MEARVVTSHDPVQVVREWVAVTKRRYTRVKLTRTIAAFEVEAALDEIEKRLAGNQSAPNPGDKP